MLYLWIKRLLKKTEDINRESPGIVFSEITDAPYMTTLYPSKDKELRNKMHQDAVLEARIKAVHDVGTGLCIHNFSQMPCERHLQCSAECKDYVWIRDDSERIEEVKRLYAITTLAQETAEKKMDSNKPKKSSDWIIHNNKKRRTLEKQLSDYGVENFDPAEYLKGVNNV